MSDESLTENSTLISYGTYAEITPILGRSANENTSEVGNGTEFLESGFSSYQFTFVKTDEKSSNDFDKLESLALSLNRKLRGYLNLLESGMIKNLYDFANLSVAPDFSFSETYLYETHLFLD